MFNRSCHRPITIWDKWEVVTQNSYAIVIQSFKQNHGAIIHIIMPWRPCHKKQHQSLEYRDATLHHLHHWETRLCTKVKMAHSVTISPRNCGHRKTCILGCILRSPVYDDEHCLILIIIIKAFVKC